MEFNSGFKGLMKGLKILRTELNTMNCFYTINSSTLDVGIIASVYSLPNFPSYSEFRAPSVLEQHPRYVPHLDRAGYNISCKQHKTLQFIHHKKHSVFTTTTRCHCCVRKLFLGAFSKLQTLLLASSYSAISLSLSVCRPSVHIYQCGSH